MRLSSFRGGIHPKYNKGMSIREPLRETPLPDKVIIPLSQHIGAPNEPVVGPGDYVEEGQIIGKSDSFISSPVHSSVHGTVKEISMAPHATLGMTKSIIIERDKEKPSTKFDIVPNVQVSGYSTQDIINKVKESGIVGMGGAAFPTYVKLTVPKGKKVEYLIINGAECEPFLTCDHTVMTRYTEKVLIGIELLNSILEPKEIIIGIEYNKKASFFAFQKLINNSTDPVVQNIRLVMLETKYPQGGEKQLIKAITGREVPPEKLPLDAGCLVHNVGTIYAIYEAVYKNKPLFERIVTFSGDCLDKPGNYRVRVGMAIKDVLEKCGIGFEQDPVKVIAGGPMMGFSQPDMEAPITKGTSGILFLSERSAKNYEEDRCIRCAKCVDVCPMHLSPTEMMKTTSKKMWDELEQLNLLDCMECGSCTYICPARIPLVQYFKEGKLALRKRK